MIKVLNFIFIMLYLVSIINVNFRIKTSAKILSVENNLINLKFYKVNAIAPDKILISWNINGNLSDKYVEIKRRFIDSVSIVGILPASEKIFIDKGLYFGTKYCYTLRVIDSSNKTIYTTHEQCAVTPVDKKSPKAPKYSYNEYMKRKYPFWKSLRYMFDQPGYQFIEYNYYLHGVNVRVLVDQRILKYVNRENIEEFATFVFKYFHRHWTIYQAYPINEYRFIVLADKKGVISEGLEFGIVHGRDIITNYYYRGEPLSHGIGHSWNGGILVIERNLPDGKGFDPYTQDSDKGWEEGWEHFNGIICLDWNNPKIPHRPLDMLEYDLKLYKNKILHSKYDMPLVDMAVLFQTPHAYYYYAKGGLIFYLINKILIENDNKTLNDFTRYLYRKYNITSYGELRDPKKLISAEDLLLELNRFSSYNFTNFFKKYIFGKEELPITHIQEKYIQALREFNETVPLRIDKIPPQIVAVQVNSLKAHTYEVQWNAKDLGSGIDHYEVRLDFNEWLNLGIKNNFILIINDSNIHQLTIKVVDKKGNTNITKITLPILLINFCNNLSNKTKISTKKPLVTSFIIKNLINNTIYITKIDINIKDTENQILNSASKKINVTVNPNTQIFLNQKILIDQKIIQQIKNEKYKVINLEYIFYGRTNKILFTQRIIIKINVTSPPVIYIKKIIQQNNTVTIEGSVQPGVLSYKLQVICDWGDGIVEKCSLPASHHYIKEGKYNISLTVIQLNGEKISKIITIKINSSKKLLKNTKELKQKKTFDEKIIYVLLIILLIVVIYLKLKIKRK